MQRNRRLTEKTWLFEDVCMKNNRYLVENICTTPVGKPNRGIKP